MVSLSCFAQSSPSVPPAGVTIANPIPASPDAAALGKYGDVPVSPATGIPNISIPLYTIKSGDLTLPVSISYHSSGNRVEEMASSVGLGWSLNAGGVITRTIKGKPDEELNGFLTQTSATQINTLLQGFNAGTLTPSQKQTLDFLLNETADGTIDSEPDEYNFNFGSYSGKFVMDNSKHITVIPKQNIVFTFNIYSSQTTYIQSFTAKTPDGVTYYFGGDYALEYTGASGSNVRHATSWYLNRIVSPTGHEIDLTYSPESYDFVTSATQTYYNLVQPSIYYGSTGQVYPPANSTVTGQTNIFNNVKLSTITFENGQLTVYAASPRQDINSYNNTNGAKAIDSVKITSGSFQKCFQFYYHNVTNARLRLDSLIGKLDRIAGTNNYHKEKYSFIYNADNWGGAGSQLTNQDWWGFFNGQTNSTLVPQYVATDSTYSGAIRAPDETSMMGGMLTQMIYPTGGHTNFTWEANTESNAYVNGTSSSKYPVTAFAYGISNDPNSSYYNNPASNYNNKPVTYFIVSTVDSLAIPVTLSAYGLRSVNPPPSPPAPVDEIVANVYGKDASGNFTIPVGSFTAPSLTVNLKPGVYMIQVIDNKDQGNPNTYPTNYIKYRASVTWSGYTAAQVAAMQNNYIAGGLRIQQIADYDGVSNKPINLRTYQYLQPGTTYSSGYLNTRAEYSYVFNMESVDQGGSGQEINWVDGWLVRTSVSNYPLATTQGAIVGYSHVTELIGQNGTGGQNEYYYTNSQSWPDLPSGPGFPYAPFQQYDWHRGVPLREVHWKYTGSGNYAMLSDKRSAYTTIQFNLHNFGIKSGFNPKPYNYGQSVSYYTNPPSGELGRLLQITYNVPTDYLYLSADTTYTYDQDNAAHSVMVTHSYQMDTTTYNLVKLQTLNSKNELITQTVTYPNNYYNPFATPVGSLVGIYNLYLNGGLNYPVEEVTQKSNPDGSNLRTINSVLTTYKARQFVRDSVFELRSVTPVTGFVPSGTGTGGLTHDSHYQPVVAFNKYDTKGNIIQEQKIGDVYHTVIWGYVNSQVPTYNTYPVAEAINADSASVAYTNFEQLGSSGSIFGNWLFSLAGITSDPNAPMGTACYNVSSSNTLSKTGLASGTSYAVSFWAKSGAAITVTGGTVTAMVTGNPKSGWVYHEYKVTGTTTVTIGGTGYVDEARLYPTTAQMSSYTFMPLAGIATKCDARSNITYYTYDNVGRLIMVQDQNKHVLKDYQYNYKPQ